MLSRRRRRRFFMRAATSGEAAALRSCDGPTPGWPPAYPAPCIHPISLIMSLPEATSRLDAPSCRPAPTPVARRCCPSSPSPSLPLGRSCLSSQLETAAPARKEVRRAPCEQAFGTFFMVRDGGIACASWHGCAASRPRLRGWSTDPFLSCCSQFCCLVEKNETGFSYIFASLAGVQDCSSTARRRVTCHQ
jgi:hypothetical protein